MDSAAETRGIAIVGMNLAQAALSFMHGRGLISNDELDALFEGVLSGMERRLPPDDPAAEYGRKLVESIAAIVRQHPMPPKHRG